MRANPAWNPGALKFASSVCMRACVSVCVYLIIIISVERRPLLDIGLPQSSPRSVLRYPHPAASRDLHQIVGPPYGGPSNAASPGTRSPFEDLSASTAVSPPRNMPCPMPLEVCNSSGYVGAFSSFTDLIISDSIAYRVRACICTLIFYINVAKNYQVL
jgi:hypothetical protein